MKTEREMKEEFAQS